MTDVYVVVHIETTWDLATVYVPRDACELVKLVWCTVDAHTLEISPLQTILVKPTNTPATASAPLAWDVAKGGSTFKDAITRFDELLTAATENKHFCFVTVDIHNLRVLLPREARDRQVVLPVYLQHPRVFDLYNEYLKWQLTHPEAMTYPSLCLSNLVTALGVEDNDDDELTARVLVELARKSPAETHPLVLTRPYDTAHDGKVFLAERSKILYLANLPVDTTQSELELWFTQFGGRPIAFWSLKNDDKSGKKGASGFAVFSKHEEAAQLLFINGRMLNDRVVEVQASSTRVLDRASELLTPFPPLKNRPRPGDWTCPSCGFSNFQRRIACFRCLFPATSAVAIQEQIYPGDNNRRKHEEKPQQQQQPQQPQQQQPSYGYSDYQPKNYANGYSYTGNGQRMHYGNSVPFRAGDWKCSNDSCQYHNFAKNLCCLKCGLAKPASAGTSHQGAGNNAAAAAAAHGSIHLVNTTAAAIAAATASGQPLNLSNLFLGLQQPQPQLRNGRSSLSLSLPIHNGMYLNISQLQQLQYQQGKQHLPQHLALLHGQGLSPGLRKQSQSSSSSPGLYGQGYQYKSHGDYGGLGINLLNSQINSLSLNNTGA